MRKRIITSIVALCVLAPVLIFSESLFFPIAMSILAAVGCYELFKCLGIEKRILLTLPMYIAALSIPIMKRLMPSEGFMTIVICSIGVIALYMFGIAVFQNSKAIVADVGLAFALCVYIIAAFTGIVYIHDSVEYGKYIYLLVFIGAWMTDSLAYFSGKFFGKHKLIPEVSPKKTVEGAIGGTICGIIATALYGLIVIKFFNPGGHIQGASYVTLCISGLFIAIASQLGDLIMSLVKRHYGIKDFGNVFPGHGGVLDRFDSVMAVSVILTLICTYFNLLI